MVRPKWIMGFGIVFLGIGSVNTIVTGNVMGRFMGLLSAPLEDKVLFALYPDTGYTKAVDILKYEVK